MAKIEMIVEKTKTGYSAYAEKHSVYSVGKTIEELKNNIVEALNLHFEKQEKKISEQDLTLLLNE